MTNPKLVQCVCPSGHSQMALKFRDIADEHAIAATAQALRDELDRHALLNFCEVCGAGPETWSYVVQPLLFELESHWIEPEPVQSFEPSSMGSLN